MDRRKRELLAERIAAFLRQYGRKRYPNIDPNDRRHDRALEGRIKRMRPEELDQLMHGDIDRESGGRDELSDRP